MEDSELILRLRDELTEEFNTNLLPFWAEYARDEKNGGFVGRITWDKQKIYEANKGGILNARLLWAFSAAYKTFPTEQIKEAALYTYQYFTQFFVDKEYGGFFWEIDAKGNMLDSRKHIYTQAFGIYGLVEYYSSFGDESALELANEIYELIEKTARDEEHGGYFEAYERDWTPCEDVRLSDKDENTPKSMNTHLHILEAYTNLYRIAPTAELHQKLKELIGYFTKYIINPERTNLNNFLDVDWTPLSKLVSYGHNIETTWLLVEAAEVLHDAEILEETKAIALNMADAVFAGIDADGGMINEMDGDEIHDSNKDWWPQVEGIIGFLNAYEISGESRYLQASVDCWEFTKKYMIDSTYGEWIEKVTREGKPHSTMDKVRLWKGPYHNMRAVFEVIRRADKLVGEEEIVKVKASK